MQVNFDNIKVGEKYGVITKRVGYQNDKFIAQCMSLGPSKTFGTFKFTMKCVCNNRVYSCENETIFYSGIGYYFFQLGQKEKIQQAMEERAFQKIMENLFGHHHVSV
jgi:hypothetical protein